MGLYRTTVGREYVPYILPQEHGNHTDVRWVALEDRAGNGVLFAGMPLMQFSVSHYTAADLFAARHTCDLRPRRETVVNIDHRQRGLGTASCGPDTLPRYRIEPGRFRFSCRIRPYGLPEQKPVGEY